MGDSHDGLWHRPSPCNSSGGDATAGIDHFSYRIDGGAEHIVAAAVCQVLLRTWKRGGNSGVHTVTTVQ